MLLFGTIWKQFVETYFFSKINIYNMLNLHVLFVFNLFILKFIIYVFKLHYF